MQRTMSRAALLAACATALAVFSAGPALAAVMAVTAPAVSVGATSAALSGTVTTGGAATQWEFAYTEANNPFVGGFTTGAVIPAGATAPTPVFDTATNLTPSTAYTFQLVAADITFGANYYLLKPVYGGPLAFTTTSAGTGSVSATTLKVKKGRVPVPLKCASTLNCHGLLAITAPFKSGKKHKKAACGSASFTIKAGKKKTVTTSKVSAKCRALLTLASKHTIKANLAVAFTTLQKPISKTVKLKLVP